MKKTYRVVLLLLVLSIGLGLLSACNSGNKMTGTWKLTSGSHKTIYMKLSSDGTGVFSSSEDGSGAENGYWTVTEDGTLKITGPIGGKFFYLSTITGEYNIDGKTLTIEDTKKGTLVFTKVSD